MTEVFWIDADGMSPKNSVVQKIRKLIDGSGALRNLDEGMQVALKINTAEVGYEYGLRPVFLRTVAAEMQQATSKSTIICDGLKFIDYRGKVKGAAYQGTANSKGYTNATLGGNFAINGGFSGDEGNSYTIRLADSIMGGVEVGTAICRADALIVLSHVTFHPLFGLSGALLNGGFESLICKERIRILDGLNPYIFSGERPPRDRLEIFHKRALEGHLGVREAMEGPVFYINYLWDITPEPEYYPYSNTPIVPNLGFLASSDPVALDAATYNILCNCINEYDPVESLTSVNFPRLLSEAADMGLGTLDHTVGRAS